MSERLRFGPFELDLPGKKLLRDGVELPVRRKVFQLLAHLAREPDRLVPKDELLAAVWPGVHISEAALASTLRELRDALGDDGGREQWIETRRGYGYRLRTERLAARDAPSSDFVGRENLLAKVESCLAALSESRGSLLLLTGEAGMGKTRTTLEIARRARMRGIPAHLGRCSEDPGASAYWPWIEILRSCSGGRPPSSYSAPFRSHAALALRLLPEWGESPSAPLRPDEGVAVRFRLFDAVTQLLVAAAREHPCVVVLDDLHRADRASLLLLGHVAQEIATLPILLVGTMRGSEVAGNDALRSWLADPCEGGVMDLPGLGAEETARLVSRIAGELPPSPVVDALQRRTDGNPLFVRELALAMLEGGGFAAEDAITRVESVAPMGLREVLRDRVARLPGTAAGILEAASVIGREFDADVLASALVGLGASSVYTAIDAAVSAGVLSEVPDHPGRFRFCHVVLRDVLYDELPPTRRATLHAAVARALETLRRGDLDAHLDALAHHFSMAAYQGEAARALDYARRAGERALERAAYEDAARFFEQALAALEHVGAEHRYSLRERAELLVAAGRARWKAADTEEAREAFLRAGELARDGFPALLAQAALGFAGRTDATMGVNHRAVALMREALGTLAPSDSPVRAELLARLGTELYFDPDPGESDTLTAEALAMAERLGEDWLIEYALSARHYALYRPTVAPATRLPLSDRLIRSAERKHASDVLAIGLQERIVDLLELGDLAKVDVTLDRYGSLVEELRQPFFLWMHAAFRAMRTCLAGDLARADDQVHAALALGQRFRLANAPNVFAGQLFELRRRQGRLAELEPILRKLVDEGSPVLAYRAGLAAVYAQMGHAEGARDAVERLARYDLRDLPQDQHWFATLAALVPAVVFLRDDRRACRLYELLVPMSGRLIVGGHGTVCLGAVDDALAVLSATQRIDPPRIPRRAPRARYGPTGG